MFICKNCNTQYADNEQASFCKKCGSKLEVFTENAGEPIDVRGTEAVVAETQHEISASETAAPATYATENYTQPQQLAEEVQPVNKGAKVMSIIGMALGIFGCVCILFTLIFTIVSFVDIRSAQVFWPLVMVYAVLFGGGNVAALVLGAKAEFYGQHSSFTRSARITGIIGAIAHGALLILEIFLAMVSCATYSGF